MVPSDIELLELVSDPSFQIMLVYMIVRMAKYAFYNMKHSHIIEYSGTLISTNLAKEKCVINNEQVCM